MINLLSYCELTDARMRASEKDLPVENLSFYKQIPSQYVNVAQLVECASATLDQDDRYFVGSNITIGIFSPFLLFCMYKV